MIIQRMLQSAHNSVYSIIFILINNLITCTILCTIHLNSYKNTITVAKYPTKGLKNQYNQRTSIHGHVKVKRPKNLQQKSSLKKESTKVNAIVKQIDKSDGNGCGRKTTVINFHQSLNQMMRKALSTGQNQRLQS